MQDPAIADPKPNDKELNFRALEAKYQRELDRERAAKEAKTSIIQQQQQQQQQQ